MENSATHVHALDEPSLPSELECIIFEIAALLRPQTIPSLMLIAQRVKHWVEPLLYRVLILSTNKGINTHGFPCIPIDVLRSAIARKPPPFFESCRLCHLAIQVIPLFAPHSIEFTAPIFRNVTHLHLSDSGGRKLPGDIGARLALAPALTHISCSCRAGVAALHARIRTAATLQCIVVFTFARRVKIHDPHDVRFMGSWLQAAATGHDYWALADAFIAAKRAGRVDGAQYHIFQMT
ncbi:hypothetical protein K438DRAFT_1805181, partial [Mycena galopus ATCC 62051]